MTVAFSATKAVEKDDTIVELKFGSQLVMLVGTAHLSKASNDQVTAVIESTQPNVVMVELDETRLERIGIESTNDLGLPFATVDDIQVPLLEDDKLPKPWWMPVQNLLLDGFTQVARNLLTGMYNDMGDSMGEVGGGEFLAAINAAKKTPCCEKIVLGDRDSLVTLRRAAELAVRSGDPLGVLARLSEANDAEMEELHQKVRENAPPDKLNDEAFMTSATIEALKADTEIRTRIFERLERDVPEFTRAFLTERDYIMAEAIQREISSGADRIVAVVGLAHVEGISRNLESWANDNMQ
jgi:pheromone shutdown protein TraB